MFDGEGTGPGYLSNSVSLKIKIWPLNNRLENKVRN